MSLPEIVGGTTLFERRLRTALSKYPSWYVDGARISKVIITNRPDVREQIAMYEHGTRHLYVWPGVGDLLQKAIGHELAHACDDIFEHLHYFSSTPEWSHIHQNQAHFDIPKYREEPLEYYADMMTKLFMIGPQKLATTNPDEVRFLTTWVIPTLKQSFQ